MTSAADIERWSGALVAFDYCDRAPLADLVASEAVPEDLRPVMAAIIAGERQPNRRAAARSKVEAGERFRIGAVISAVLETIKDLHHPEITGPYADKRGIEPVDAVRRLDSHRERLYEAAMKRLGVSRETVENLVRDYRKKVREWPHV